MQMAILYAVAVHYFILIPVDSYNGTVGELCDVNIDIPTNCTICIKCCNATESDHISIPTYCSKCPGCNEGRYFWIVVNMNLLNKYTIVIMDFFIYIPS